MGRSCKTQNYKTKIKLFYTLLSRATNRDKVKLVNFNENVIKCNDKAKEEMKRLGNTSVLTCKHPLKLMRGGIICLHNIRTCDKHIGHFHSDKKDLNLSSILCFTETNKKSRNPGLRDFNNGTWETIQKHTDHGLAVCYN